VSRSRVRVGPLTISTYLAKLPELVRFGLQHSNATLVHESRRWVPRLNLLPENDLDVVCILGLDEWDDGVVDCVKHLLGELQ
jgi:hypothetical protein